MFFPAIQIFLVVVNILVINTVNSTNKLDHIADDTTNDSLLVCTWINSFEITRHDGTTSINLLKVCLGYFLCSALISCVLRNLHLLN